MHVQRGYILEAIIFFVFIMAVLLVFSISALAAKNETDLQKKRWLNKINSLITAAIFFEGEERDPIPVPPKLRKLLKKQAFRNFFCSQLVLSAKSISGISNNNLIKLYEQLSLMADSQKRLKSFSWHIKAKAIQELAMMNQKPEADELSRLTNHKNAYIRMEAQTATVKFDGFEGLRFLDNATYPISEWQQINLLHELSHTPAENFQGIDKWLASPNDSVVLFTLKLVSTYHIFGFHPEVLKCLHHPNNAVATEAIKCLQEIYTDTTSAELIDFYKQSQFKAQKLAVLKALKVIEGEEYILFLLDVLNDDDNQIKLAAARALAVNPIGMNELKSFSKSDRYPWNEMIYQIQHEHLA